MTRTLNRNWWLLALCAGCQAAVAVVYFGAQFAGSHTLSALALLGKLTLAAGVCSIAAGFSKSSDARTWLLAIHGFALCTLGLLFSGIAGPKISLRSIALLIAVAAICAGIVEFAAAPVLHCQRRFAAGWFFLIAAAVSLGFVFPLLALAFHWIKLGPESVADRLWLGSYFASSAICLFALSLYWRNWPEASFFSRPFASLPSTAS